MARHKDRSWNLPDQPDWSNVKVAVLMDIRDELKELNRTLACPNARAIPGLLRDIKRNTTKPRRKTKRKPKC